MNIELQKKIGRLFVCGFESAQTNEHARFLARELKIANWIYFARNVQSHEQLAELSRELLRETWQHNGALPFISIDQEGGIVSRFHGDLNTYPGAMALAATGSEDSLRRAARITAEHLGSLGINMNLAPICDINSNPENPIIGPRSYGDSPETVGRFSSAAMEGYIEGGIVPVLKHFPGHGDSAVDSHRALPLLPHSRETLEKRELLPFVRGIASAAPAIMVAHILVPAFDGSAVPASLSQEIISDLLRSSLQFKGLVLTDCLEMMAVREHFSSSEAALLALKAGADLIFISHSAEEQEEGARALYDAVMQGDISEARIDASLERIRACKDRFFPDADEKQGIGTFAWQGMNPDPVLQDMSRKSLTLVRNRTFLNTSFLPEGKLPDSPKTFILVLERPEQFIGENTVSGDRPAKRLKAAFHKSGFCMVPADSPAQELLPMLQGKGLERILIISSDAAFCPNAPESIQAICELETLTGVAVMRTPYEAAQYSKADFIVLTYEDTVLAFDSLIAFLHGNISADGSLPVHIPGLE